jgi:hypothetical protein
MIINSLWQDSCHKVLGTFPASNGIAISKEAGEVYVADVKTGDARIFQIIDNDDTNNQLVKLERTASVALGGQADNVNVVASTGDLVLSGALLGLYIIHLRHGLTELFPVFPSPEKLSVVMPQVRNLGKTLRIPACAI